MGINERTAQRWWKKYTETNELPVSPETCKLLGRKSKVTEEHCKFVAQIVEENPQATVNDVLESLTKQFEGLTISRSQLHYHMKITLNLTVKYATFESVARNDTENLEKRFEWYQIYAKTDLDFLKNCVFIDKASFHINMKNNWAWAEKGATTHIIIGAIAAVGVMHVALRKPPPPKSRSKSTTKNRKTNKG